MGKNFFIVLSISAFSARAGNPPSMIDKAEEGVRTFLYTLDYMLSEP